MVEFWEDYYAQRPLEAHRNKDGHVQFKDTGDDMIDRWEQQLAEGETPDFMEAFSEEQRKRLERLRKKGNSRVTGRSMKAVADAVDREAQQAGLRPRPGWEPGFDDRFPSTFGNGE